MPVRITATGRPFLGDVNAGLSIHRLARASVKSFLRPRPVMMRFPNKLAIAHFNQGIEGGLKALAIKAFRTRMQAGDSVAAISG